VVVDDGQGMEQFARWRDALAAVARCSPAPVLVPAGSPLSPAELEGADALLVCGGPTPAYADALAPVAEQLRGWLAAGDRPYAGFSAGAAVAAVTAVVGGWRQNGAPVCPQEAGEDLDAVAVRPGIGLLPFAVDVHCSSWGTLPRLIAAVRSHQVSSGVALDEDTALTRARRPREDHRPGTGLPRASRRRPAALGRAGQRRRTTDAARRMSWHGSTGVWVRQLRRAVGRGGWPRDRVLRVDDEHVGHEAPVR
jgi:hypothetical protein